MQNLKNELEQIEKRLSELRIEWWATPSTVRRQFIEEGAKLWIKRKEELLLKIEKYEDFRKHQQEQHPK